MRSAKLGSSVTLPSTTMFPCRAQRGEDGAHLGHGEMLADATPRTEPEREQCTRPFRCGALVSGGVEARAGQARYPDPG